MKKLFKNLSFVTISELIEKAIIFLLFIYMGRVLEPIEFGYLNYILALASYFIIFINLGLPQLATREISANKNISNSLLSVVFIIKLFLFLFVAIFWIIFIFYTQNEYLYVGLFFVFYLLSRVIDIFWYLQGMQNFTVVAKIKLFKSLILAIAFVVLYYYPYLLNYIIILTISLIMPFVFYMIKLNLHIINISKIKFLLNNLNRVKILISKSLPLIASTFLILMYYNLDTILIEYFIDLKAVARYNAAYKLIFAFIVIRSIFTSVIFPRISKDKLKWNEGNLFLGIGILVSLIIFFISYYFSKDILFLAYGDKYILSDTVFMILSLTASILWINLFFPIFFIAIKKDIFYMRVHIVTALINLIGNIVLIPLYGIEGAAIATLTADIVSLLIFGFMYFKIKREF